MSEAAASPTPHAVHLRKDDDLLAAEVASFSVTGMERVAQWVRQLVHQAASGAFPHYWAEVYLFGSSGLGAAIEGSDADLYGARVPLIKFVYGAVSVDIVFASVALLAPPTAEQIRQDEFLFTVSSDDRSNVNGIRTVLEIQNRVLAPYHVYITALKAVKRWATRRMIYGNLFTFPNGVALAIMVARVCRMYNQVNSPAQLFRLFFSFYSVWLAKHDRVMPVFLTDTLKAKPIHIPGMPSCWDLGRESCREELIPVLNPAYPYVNAAHTVGRCGFTHFYAEVVRAHALLSPKQNQPLVSSALPQVWAPYRITDDYAHFVAVHVACVHKSESECRDMFGVWKGLVESRLRILIYALETFYDVRPLPQYHERSDLPSRPGQRGGRQGSTNTVLEGIFFLGLKNRGDTAGSEGPSLSPGYKTILQCFREWEYAIEDSVAAGSKGTHTFTRSLKVMRDPWLTLHHIDDDDFPPELLQSPE